MNGPAAGVEMSGKASTVEKTSPLDDREWINGRPEHERNGRTAGARFAKAPLPNFFLVGAAKAGTTSLYHYLRSHPQIYVSPIKEPCFFATDIELANFGPD